MMKVLMDPVILRRAGSCVQLEVDLRASPRTISGNAQKFALLDEFGGAAKEEAFRAVSDRTHAFLRGHESDGSLEIDVPGLRWTSAGVLPVVRWRGRTWACLFFRDIFPIGWNVANGASESEREQWDLERVAFREFREECVIVGEPSADGNGRHFRSLVVPGAESEWPREQARLRLEHDALRLERVDGPSVEILATHQEVAVSHAGGDRASKAHANRDVLIAVNPFELGIEVVKVCRFDLGDDDELLDGEVGSIEGESYLVRRPIALIDLEFIRRAIDGSGRLGAPVTGEESPDARDLGHVPPEAVHVFGREFPLRRGRLESLRVSGSSSAEAEEVRRIEIWNQRYLAPFEDVARDGLRGQLATLVATTWKTLELAVAGGIV